MANVGIRGESGAINNLLAGISEFKTATLDATGLLTCVDYFVLRSPRVGRGFARSSAQTNDLTKGEGWSPQATIRVVEATLFNSNTKYCKQPKQFTVEARKQSYYSDQRVKGHDFGAFVLLNGSWNFNKGRERFSESENKANCIFRHIRNAIAHGGIYRIGHGKCLLVDRSDGNKGSVSAYMVTSFDRLLRLRSLLEQGPK